jgi:hypothetical protein
MKNIFVLILIFGILGIVVGYLLFAKIGGEYISLKYLFNSGGALQSLGEKFLGIDELKQNIKQNVMISGGVGGIVGLFVYYILKKK